MSLTNWAIACMTKQYGGLGVSNLNIANVALLLRWWWKPYNDPNCLWSITINLIGRKGRDLRGPKIWLASGSFFWNQLHKIKYLFHWSTSWLIGDGGTIAYWYDSWEGLPRAATVTTTILKPNMSLREAWPHRIEMDPQAPATDSIVF